MKRDKLKGTTGTVTSGFAKKTDLANLKSNFDKLDIDKLKTVPVDLRTLSNVVNNDRVKKTVYDKLVKKVKIMQGRQKHKKSF